MNLKFIITWIVALVIILSLIKLILKDKRDFNLKWKDYGNLFISEFSISAGIALIIYVILTYLGFNNSSGKWYGYLFIISLAFLLYGLGKITLIQTEKKINRKIK